VTEQEFAVTADQLWAVLTDPVRYPGWLVGAKRIREVSPDWPEAGGYFKHTVGFGPITVSDRTIVREVEPRRLLALFVRARPVIEAVVRFDVTSRGSLCTLRMTETPLRAYKLITPLARPLIRVRNERSMKRLKDIVESATTSQAQ